MQLLDLQSTDCYCLLHAAGLTDHDQTPAGHRCGIASVCYIAVECSNDAKETVFAAATTILHPAACPLLLPTVAMLLLLLSLLLSARTHVQVEVTAVLAILSADLHGPARASRQIGSTE
jgi:hypothetical protein